MTDERVARIFAGLDKNTGFYEFIAYESDIPTEEERWPDWNNQKYFLIRPTPPDKLVVAAYDMSHPENVPQSQPELIHCYTRPQDARRRLAKETTLHIGKLMKDFDIKFLSNLGRLLDLDALPHLERALRKSP